MNVKENFYSLIMLFDIVCAVIIGFALYFVFIYFVCCQWQIIPIDLKRIIEIKNFLDRQQVIKNNGQIYFLGSSILLEGIDCNLIDSSLIKQKTCYNLSWTGADPLQWIFILPSLQKATPDLVVLFADLTALTRVRPVPENLLTIAGWFNFLSAEELYYFKSTFTQNESNFLNRSRLEYLLAFRSLPLGALDAYMRETSRKDMRYEGHRINFKDPWVCKRPLSSDKKVRLLKILYDKLSKRSVNNDQLRILDNVCTFLNNNHCQTFLVLPPVNPDLTKQLGNKLLNNARQALSELAQKHGAVFLDYSMLLKPEDFTDDVHPSKSGRILWSTSLGKEISSKISYQN
jgi:hypothetical protein